MTEILNQEIISEAKDMMKDKFDKMVEYFLEDSITYVNQVEEEFNNNNAEGVVPPSHTLKSSSKQMGAMLLSEISADIELTSREIVKGNGSLEDIKDKITVLKDALGKTQEAYKEIQ